MSESVSVDLHGVTHYPYRILAICSWIVVAAVSLPPLGNGRGWWSYGLRALVYFVAALITRYSVQHVESRLQIAGFATMAGIFVFIGRQSLNGRSPFGLWAAATAGATLGVLLAKHALEPGAISLFVSRLLDRL